jgi:hypothetical protein
MTFASWPDEDPAIQFDSERHIQIWITGFRSFAAAR